MFPMYVGGNRRWVLLNGGGGEGGGSGGDVVHAWVKRFYLFQDLSQTYLFP